MTFETPFAIPSLNLFKYAGDSSKFMGLNSVQMHYYLLYNNCKHVELRKLSVLICPEKIKTFCNLEQMEYLLKDANWVHVPFDKFKFTNFTD